jgi:lactoylglutathione lyase
MIESMNGHEVISLLFKDLPRAGLFYGKVFAHEIIFEDDVCSILRIGNIVINLLRVEKAPNLVTPLLVGGPGVGSRALYTVKVEDANSVCSDLAALGIKLLNGPIDRPWGCLTAAIADPAGNVWDVAQELGAG